MEIPNRMPSSVGKAFHILKGLAASHQGHTMVTVQKGKYRAP